MTWHRILYNDGWFTHVVHASLFQQVLVEMTARGATMWERNSSGGPNPTAIARWCFDAGGSVHQHQPEETIVVDDLEIDVLCEHVPFVLGRLQRTPLRAFADGSEYYKAKFWMHATVLTRSQMRQAVVALSAVEKRSRERQQAFLDSLRREGVGVN